MCRGRPDQELPGSGSGVQGALLCPVQGTGLGPQSVPGLSLPLTPSLLASSCWQGRWFLLWPHGGADAPQPSSPAHAHSHSQSGGTLGAGGLRQ